MNNIILSDRRWKNNRKNKMFCNVIESILSH